MGNYNYSNISKNLKVETVSAVHNNNYNEMIPNNPTFDNNMSGLNSNNSANLDNIGKNLGTLGNLPKESILNSNSTSSEYIDDIKNGVKKQGLKNIPFISTLFSGNNNSNNTGGGGTQF